MLSIEPIAWPISRSASASMDFSAMRYSRSATREPQGLDFLLRRQFSQRGADVISCSSFFKTFQGDMVVRSYES